MFTIECLCWELFHPTREIVPAKIAWWGDPQSVFLPLDVWEPIFQYFIKHDTDTLTAFIRIGTPYDTRQTEEEIIAHYRAGLIAIDTVIGILKQQPDRIVFLEGDDPKHCILLLENWRTMVQHAVDHGLYLYQFRDDFGYGRVNPC